MPKSRVALVRGKDRYENVKGALAQIATDIDLADKKHVLIKPNFVITHDPLSATHADAVQAVLEFVRARYDGPLTIAEGPAIQTAAEGFENYGYQALARQYDARLLDLNHDEAIPVDAYDRRLQPLRLHMARSVVESDFRISVGPPKTHDVVILTLSLKNMIMGSLISRFTHNGHENGNEDHSGLNLGEVTKFLWGLVPAWARRLSPVEFLSFWAMSNLEPSDKMKMHQSYPVINLNLALLAPLVAPHLAVVDGFEGMEGNGPTHGTAVPLGLAWASTDALAADVVGARLMGFDPDEVGYLHYCKQLGLGNGELSAIEIVGNVTLAKGTRPFQPHDTYNRQRRWQLPGVEAYLRPPKPTI